MMDINIQRLEELPASLVSMQGLTRLRLSFNHFSDLPSGPILRSTLRLRLEWCACRNLSLRWYTATQSIAWQATAQG